MLASIQEVSGWLARLCEESKISDVENKVGILWAERITTCVANERQPKK